MRKTLNELIQSAYDLKFRKRRSSSSSSRSKRDVAPDERQRLKRDRSLSPEVEEQTRDQSLSPDRETASQDKELNHENSPEKELRRELSPEKELSRDLSPEKEELSPRQPVPQLTPPIPAVPTSKTPALMSSLSETQLRPSTPPPPPQLHQHSPEKELHNKEKEAEERFQPPPPLPPSQISSLDQSRLETAKRAAVRAWMETVKLENQGAELVIKIQKDRQRAEMSMRKAPDAPKCWEWFGKLLEAVKKAKLFANKLSGETKKAFEAKTEIEVYYDSKNLEKSRLSADKAKKAENDARKYRVEIENNYSKTEPETELGVHELANRVETAVNNFLKVKSKQLSAGKQEGEVNTPSSTPVEETGQTMTAMRTEDKELELEDEPKGPAETTAKPEDKELEREDVYDRNRDDLDLEPEVLPVVEKIVRPSPDEKEKLQQHPVTDDPTLEIADTGKESETERAKTIEESTEDKELEREDAITKDKMFPPDGQEKSLDHESGKTKNQKAVENIEKVQDIEIQLSSGFPVQEDDEDGIYENVDELEKTFQSGKKEVNEPETSNLATQDEQSQLLPFLSGFPIQDEVYEVVEPKFDNRDSEDGPKILLDREKSPPREEEPHGESDGESAKEQLHQEDPNAFYEIDYENDKSWDGEENLPQLPMPQALVSRSDKKGEKVSTSTLRQIKQQRKEGLAAEFIFNEMTQRFYINIGVGVMHMDVSKHLSYVLGFDKTRIFYNDPASYVPDLSGGVRQLYVYAPKLVEDTIIGDRLSPLLRVVNATGTPGVDMPEVIYTNEFFHSLQNKRISEIRIEIQTAFGRYVKFNWGTTGIAAGTRVLGDLAQGKALKESLQTHAKQGFENLAEKLEQCGKALNQTGPYLFRLFSDSQYCDLSKTYLYLLTSIERIEVFDSSIFYHYRAYIMQELSYSHEVRRAFHEAGCYYVDENNQDSYANKGFLNFDLARQSALLLNNQDVVFTIHRNSDSFLLLTPPWKTIVDKTDTWHQNPEEYRIRLHDMRLFVRTVDVTPSLNIAISKQLELSSAKYALRKVEIRRLICTFVSTNAYSGSQRLSPFNFEHANVRSISAEANGMTYPSTPYHFSFEGDQKRFVRAFVDMYAGLGLDDSDSIPYCQVMDSLRQTRSIADWLVKAFVRTLMRV
uniref:Uncharacterized protein n=1 Tax=Globodera rostochiensis TaxID=31243 RepID=A0A914HN96_GLORO